MAVRVNHVRSDQSAVDTDKTKGIADADTALQAIS